jgi:hypothetical protein
MDSIVNSYGTGFLLLLLLMLLLLMMMMMLMLLSVALTVRELSHVNHA